MRRRTTFLSWLVFSAALGAAGLCSAALWAAEPLPIARLAQVSFRVGDLEKARQFYGTIMGFAEAFPIKDAQGQPGGRSFQVNDDQFLAFLPGAEKEGEFRLERVSLLTPDIQQARQMLQQRKVPCGEIHKEADGNPHFSFADPDGTRFEFVQYMPGSPQLAARGKSNGARQVAEHLQHVGLAVADQAVALGFYRDQLGFWETKRGGPTPGDIRWINQMMPGTHGDYVELMVHAAEPVLRRHHLCFGVADIQRAYKLLLEHGQPPRFKPFVGVTGDSFINLRDPNGIRVEFMEVKKEAGK